MTTTTNFWQQAWNDTEPRLQSLKHSLGISNFSPRALRVGQLDAELLDEELVQLLSDPISKSLVHIYSAFRTNFEPELLLTIKLLLYKFSIWNIGSSYGAKLQDLRYQTNRSIGKGIAPSGLPKGLLAIHALLTIFVPYIRTRLRNYALSNAWPDRPSSDRRRKAWNTIERAESLHACAALMNFVVFLWNGRYRTVADRLLGLRLVPSGRLANRQVSYEFMNRQMVWHAFTEFLLLILPVFSSRSFRRTYNQVNSGLKNLHWRSILPLGNSEKPGNTSKLEPKGPYALLPNNECAICAENSSFSLSNLTGTSDTHAFALPIPSSTEEAETNQESSAGPPSHQITTPYITPCGHTYCYVCISERLMRCIDDGEDGWTCLRCTELVRSCERVQNRYDDSAHTSEGWASEMDDLTSFESDIDMSVDSEYERSSASTMSFDY